MIIVSSHGGGVMPASTSRDGSDEEEDTVLNLIHVQYTQIDLSRIQALTTHLSGSLLVNPTGSGSFLAGSYDC